MNDLISRQVAIDAIEEMQMPIMRSTFAEEQFVFRGMSEALNAIKDLPSAEPTQSNADTTQTNAERTGRWIPCSERLPAVHPVQMDDDITEQFSIVDNYYMISDPVLIVAERKHGSKDDPAVFIGYYEDDFDGRTAWQTYDCEDLINVKAWMPMPKLYKEVEHE